MSLGTGVTIEGGERVSALLGALVIEGARRSDLLGELGDALITQTQLRFLDQQGPDGEGWTPSDRARRQGGQTLLDTGRLRGSITKAADGDRVEVGTNLLYSLAMQFGLTLEAAPGRRLVFPVGDKTIFAKRISYPGRPFLGINEADSAELGETVVDYLAALVDRVT